MFGYVVVNQKSLKEEELKIYREFYCGLCEALKRRYGLIGRLALSYDMTFVVMLLTGLYDTDTAEEDFRCLARPQERQQRLINDFSYYGADMTVILSYYKCVDDWQDERKKKSLIASWLLKGKFRKAERLHPEKAKNIKNLLGEINNKEKENTENIDLISGLFGKVMADIVAMKNDSWAPLLNKLGFYLGKFIYIMDAYDDVEKDIESGSYNPFKNKFGKNGFEEETERILNMMMAECAQSFELLPIVDNIEILRNIIYAGVWAKFEMTKARRKDKYGSI
ncbi:MAG: hypothetical protein E7235_07190 [Lachnospiraceae bacterium]|nr:hypothetical protein [Lachnospiraceae bacterium]